MPKRAKPVILVTNDDGVASPGLAAAAAAVHDLGELLIVAPKHQQTGASRNFLPHPGTRYDATLVADGEEMAAVAFEASPAQVVRAAILLLASRRPDLLISGINYGENVGAGTSISGTIGAAIEGATFGVPALAVSLETGIEQHLSHSQAVDFTAAAAITQRLARHVLQHPLPAGVDILKVDVPSRATPDTPWRITRVSRQRYFQSTVVWDEQLGGPRFTGYERRTDFEAVERDSDVYALAVDEVVSISPLTFDLTAPVPHAQLAAWLDVDTPAELPQHESPS